MDAKLARFVTGGRNDAARRCATDGYGDPRSIVDAIELAGKVDDLSVVDLNWPFFGGDFSNEQVKAALDAQSYLESLEG